MGEMKRAQHERTVEIAATGIFQTMGYEYVAGPDLEGLNARTKMTQVILEERCKDSLRKLNPDLEDKYIEQVYGRISTRQSADLLESNHHFHKMLVKGVSITVHTDRGEEGRLVRLVDFDNPENNHWLVTNQFTVRGPHKSKTPDLLVFLNGMPIAVFELKSPANEQARLKGAWNQLQNYKDAISDLFVTNEILVISDGFDARFGSLSAGHERFMPWRTIDGDRPQDNMPEYEVVIRGIFEKQHLLDYLKHFIMFEQNGRDMVKIIGGYHQVRAVREAIKSCREKIGESGERDLGVVWHTTGSGKSISMVFLAAWALQEAYLESPTIVVLTDRRDLDDQLFGQFARATDLLADTPEQAPSNAELRKMLDRNAGGIIFTTIQRFVLSEEDRDHMRARFPTLSERKNIIVIADEAHRSHYNFGGTGLAQNLRDALPNAAFIGFTGTPLEEATRSTESVFGTYLDRYTIKQAQEDGVVVPLRYESRQAKILLPEENKPVVDEEFEDATEDADEVQRDRLKSSWSQLARIVGSEERLDLVASDLIEHWERRQKILEGKAMIVCMTRQICVDLYKKITELRPDWAGEKDENGVMIDDPNSGKIKVVFTGSSSDPQDFQMHVRDKKNLKVIEERFRDAKSDLELVIVCDMWLTGFNVPSAHTLYLDKPIKSHNLIQAVSRINRVFKDKPEGLIVDYLGLTFLIQEAVDQYARDSGEQEDAISKEDALAALEHALEKVRACFEGYDYEDYLTSEDEAEQLRIIQGAMNHIEEDEDNTRREAFFDAILTLNKATALALHKEEAEEFRDEIGFFQLVYSVLKKQILTGSGSEDGADYDDMSTAIKEVVSQNIKVDGLHSLLGELGRVVDITQLDKALLEKKAGEENKSLQASLLARILQDEIKSRSGLNVAQSQRFSEKLSGTLESYKNRTTKVEEVLEKLLELKAEIVAAQKRGEELGLSSYEVAFYDALLSTKNIATIKSDELLMEIARALTKSIRESATLDWHKHPDTTAKMRVAIKRALRKAYPREELDNVIELVIEQAQQFGEELAA